MPLRNLMIGSTLGVCLLVVWVVMGSSSWPEIGIVGQNEEVGVESSAEVAVAGAGPGGDSLASHLPRAGPVGQPEPKDPAVLESTDLAPLEYDVERWRRARGYFDQADLNGYATYGLETLAELSKSGDLIAMHLFAEALDAAGEHESASVVRHAAAVQGSTAALTALAADYRTELWELGEEQVVERKEALGKMLVYAEVAALRGDYTGVVEGILEIDDSGVQLSPSEVAEISRTARMIYEDLAQKRESLGLPDFDNGTPMLELATNSFMLSQFRTRSGWGPDLISRLPELVPADPSP